MIFHLVCNYLELPIHIYIYIYGSSGTKLIFLIMKSYEKCRGEKHIFMIIWKEDVLLETLSVILIENKLNLKKIEKYFQ